MLKVKVHFSGANTVKEVYSIKKALEQLPHVSKVIVSSQYHVALVVETSLVLESSIERVIHNLGYVVKFIETI